MKKTLPVLLMFFVFICSTASRAQCPYGALDIPKITTGTKIIITEIAKDEPEYEKIKYLKGKQVTVGIEPLLYHENCWYAGEVVYDGVEYYIMDMQVKRFAEQKEKPAPAATAEFPVGAKVKIYNLIIENPKNPDFYADKPAEEIGFVVEQDLTKVGYYYTGCIKSIYGDTKICFKEKQVEHYD